MLLHCNVLYCVPWLNCYSQPRHDLWRGFTVTNAMLRHSPTKGWKCTAKDLTSRNWWFHIWILGLAKMIKSSLRQFPQGVLLPFLISSLSLVWRAIARRLLFHVLLQGTGAHIKLSRVSPFFCPHLTCYQSCDLLEGPWSDNVAFFSTNFQDISPPGWMHGSVWPNAREGFDETPIGPLGSKRQLMGGWNAIIAIHQPLQN